MAHAQILFGFRCGYGTIEASDIVQVTRLLEGDLFKAIMAGDDAKIRQEYAKLAAARTGVAQLEASRL